jgi:hypothetical protein
MQSENNGMCNKISNYLINLGIILKSLLIPFIAICYGLDGPGVESW